ncbi:MAG: nucleotidyltransferase domain-containing protein [Proteobacteria bacterium]|nr:nucleotidyltransferase domain-containing protein [Pseudomonadota bacterium]
MAKKSSNKLNYKKIQDYLDILKIHGVDIWRVYLYGSYVKGQQTQDSDIDLAIFLDTDEIDGFEEDALFMKLRRKIDLRIEPHSFAKTDFDQTNPVVKEIIKTGERIL